MTGKSNRKTRVYLSGRLYSPLAQRKDFTEAITEFKRSVSNSIAQPRLNADIAVKAMPATQGNTDGKKRTNTGQTPGVTNIDGIRFKPNERGGEGKIFKWIPSIHDRMNPSRSNVNFGWMSHEDMGKNTEKRTKPEVRVRKYRINPKTNEAIDGSEERINPYNLASDEPLEKGLEFKKLPGRSVLDSVPGGTLAGRAAARFGIWIDEFNKMRCPPGTPAANQFTDATGSNCFGLSPSGLINIAQEVIKRSDLEVLDQISNRLAAKDPARNGLSSGRIQNDPWWKNHWGAKKSNQKNAGNGYKLDIDPRTISVAETPSQFRWFVTGAKRAQNGMEASKKRVGKLVQSLGVDATPEEMATNAHLFRAIDELNARGMLDLQIGAPSDFSKTAVGRPSYEQVRSHIIQKLSGTSASWNDLSDAQKEKIIQADIERYYEIERQMVEAFLDAYVQMPEHMKNIKYLSYANPNNRKDEAEAYSLGENFEESMIKIDIITIMDNQEKMLPSMDEYHKLRIDAINGSDAENAQEMADFLVSSQIEARRTAAMAMGHEAFARHIMYHEIGHTVQISAVGRELKRRGLLPEEATNTQIANIIMDILGDPNNNFLESWNGILTKTEAVKFLAGSYPTDVERVDGRTLGLVEAQAELFALRMSGLIWGDDIDNALGYMDDIADGRFAEDRLGFQQMEQSVFDAAAVGDIPVAPSAIYRMTLDDARRRRIDEKKKVLENTKRDISKMSDDEFIDSLIYSEASVIEAERVSDGSSLLQQELDLYKEIDIEHQREARRRFGNDANGKKKLREKIRSRKEERGLLSSDEQSSLDEERRKARENQSISDIASNAQLMSDEELVENLVVAEADAKDARDIANSELPDSPERKEWEKEAELQERIADTYREVAKNRFGSDPSGRKKLEKAKLDSREKRNLLTQEEAKKITEQRRIKQINDNAKNDNEDTLVQRLADIEAELADPSISEIKKEQLLSEKRKYRQAITKRRRDSGDESTQQRISRYIDKQVEKKLIDSGRKEEKKKKPKAFRGSKDAEEHAINERSRLLQKATPQEREAIIQMADPDVVDIGQLLNPSGQVGAAKAINKRNRRATRNGNEVDESSREVGSLVGQVENILIPSLDLIDKSELDEAVEIETEMELDALQLRGAKNADDIVVDSLIRGRVMTSSKPFTGSAQSKEPEIGGKTKTKVVVRAQKGQKGYFPHWSDETSNKPKNYDQPMVMPPGKLRITEKRIDKDGNEILIAEVVHQDDAMKSLTSMLDNIGEEGPEPTQHAKGTRKKLEKTVNAYAARRAREGRYAETVTPEHKAEKIRKRNSDISSDISESGGDGPSGMSPAKAKEASNAIKNDGTESIFGKVESKEDRKQSREEKHLSVISSIRDLITFGGSDSELEIDEDDITPEIRQLIEEKSDDEILDLVKSSAKKFHDSLDKRPRLRFWDDQLEQFISDKETGVKAPEAMDDAEDSRSIADIIRSGIRALDTQETRDLLANISKTAAKKLAEDEIKYMIEDGTLDQETADKIVQVLDGLIPDEQAEIDPVLIVNAVKSVIEKRKSESQMRGLSSGVVGTVLNTMNTVWSEWNNADPDNLQMTQDMVTRALALAGSDVSDVPGLVEKIFKKMKTGSAVRQFGDDAGDELGKFDQARAIIESSMLLQGAKFKDVKKFLDEKRKEIVSRRRRRRGIELSRRPIIKENTANSSNIRNETPNPAAQRNKIRREITGSRQRNREGNSSMDIAATRYGINTEEYANA